jgi:CRP-like cAMP-binding protein
MDGAASRRALSERGWLAVSPADFRDAVLDVCRWRSLSAGESLYVAGDPPGGIFGIASGALLMSHNQAPPGAPPNRLAGAGEWSGFGPLLSLEPRRASVEAAVKSIVAIAPLSAITTLLDGHPQWWRHFGHGLLLEFDSVASMAVDLQLQSSAQRCAAILLHGAGCRHAPPSPSTDPVVWTSHQNIAALANMSRSTLAKTLPRLAERGLLKLEYRSIRLLDVPGLMELANRPRRIEV